MPRVTALHPERRDWVRVELDGEAWRTLPAAAVVAAGLRVGVKLDRVRARELGRAVRHAQALDVAGRALANRSRSAAGLAAHLEQRGIAPVARTGAIQTMSRLGYIDDRRFAVGRAEALAGRGYGDDAIRFDLERQGLTRDEITEALGAVEPELSRIRAVLEAGPVTAKVLRRLAARGFSEDSVREITEHLQGGHQDIIENDAMMHPT